MKRNKIKIWSFVFAVLVIFASCKNVNNQASQNQLDSLSVNKSSFDTISEIVYAVPDPDEMLNEIFHEDFKFKNGLVNPTDNANAYFKSKSVALNMGIFIADMAYLIIQEKNNLALEYFKTIVQMSNTLDLKDVPYSDLYKIENNIDNKDSLLLIVKESIKGIKAELEYSKRNKYIALIYTGTIVETFYLAMNNIEGEKAEIIIKILEQNIILDNLHSFISNYKEEPELKQIITQIDSIKILMDKCIKKSEVQVKKSEQNNLIIEGGNEVNYTIDDFKLIELKITELRNFITCI